MFEEVFDDLGDSFKDIKKGNGLSFLVIGFVVLFVIMLLKDNNEDAEVVYQYSSYPSVDKNADVIIDSLYDSLQYSQAELEEKIDENFIATQDYINEGLEKQYDLSSKIYDDTMANFDDLTTKIENVNTNVTNVGSKVDSVNNNVSNLGSSFSSALSSVQSQISSVASSVSKVQDDVTKVQSDVNKVQSTVSSNTTTLNKVVSNTSKTATSTTKTNTSASKTSTNTIKATSYSGNSIVDGLKSVGVNSSYAYRSQLAAANGISNYTGSASQNTALLNKLKEGTLKKA